EEPPTQPVPADNELQVFSRVPVEVEREGQLDWSGLEVAAHRKTVPHIPFAAQACTDPAERTRKNGIDEIATPPPFIFLEFDRVNRTNPQRWIEAQIEERRRRGWFVV